MDVCSVIEEDFKIIQVVLVLNDFEEKGYLREVCLICFRKQVLVYRFLCLLAANTHNFLQ